MSLKTGNTLDNKLLATNSIIPFNRFSASASLSMKGVRKVVAPEPTFSSISVKLALNFAKASAGMLVAMSPNLPSNCPIMAALRAVSFSISVSSVVVLFIEWAKSLYTLSSLIITPSSSRISGSAFTIPRVKRSIASPIFLPRATEAARAPLVILSICLAVKPAVVANAVLVDASWKSSIYPEAFWIVLAICAMFLPVWAAYSCCPFSSIPNWEALCRAV